VSGTQPSTPDSTASRWFELLARSASGGVMAIAAVAALIAGGLAFFVVILIGAVAALREWHRLINDRRLAREMFITGLTMIAVIWLAREPGQAGLAVAAMFVGAAIAALSAALRRLPVLWPIPWHAFGAFYIGLAVLALVLLRDAPHGVAIIGALFVAVWTADTGALFFGRVIGGPKLAPVLSPNKTWAGFIGGTLAAGLAEAIYFVILGGSLPMGAGVGLFLAVVGHCGDLFESWVKRQFRAKNTGTLIPGHGGMLDRIDSLLFAAPACAVLFYLHPFFGVPS
jgi:phosphatidate cytidylyltransferase